jgi:hypothetical protein
VMRIISRNRHDTINYLFSHKLSPNQARESGVLAQIKFLPQSIVG